jgi:hypothetical protein
MRLIVVKTMYLRKASKSFAKFKTPHQIERDVQKVEPKINIGEVNDQLFAWSDWLNAGEIADTLSEEDYTVFYPPETKDEFRDQQNHVARFVGEEAAESVVAFA